MGKKILAPALLILLVLAVSAVLFFGQKKTTQKSAELKLTPEMVTAFFPTGEECIGQEEEIKSCEANRGKWSCSAKHCFLSDENQLLNNYQAKCLNQKVGTFSECLQKALREASNVSKWIKPGEQGCIGKPESIKRCTELGMQWHCKIGACLPSATYPNFFKSFYRDCFNDEKCIARKEQAMKKICVDQFNNEECLPDDKTVEMNRTQCSKMDPPSILRSWSPKFNACAEERIFTTYFNYYEQCLSAKTHPKVLSPEVQNPVFETAEKCIENLTREYTVIVNANAAVE